MPLLEGAHKTLVHLTQREHQVFELVCRGRINKQIAVELGISPRTVELHRSRACEKLGLKGKRATLEWARLRDAAKGST